MNKVELPVYQVYYLKDSQQGLPKAVKVVPIFLLNWIVIELSSEDLHAQQREDHDEEEEQQQKGGDGLDRVEK